MNLSMITAQQVFVLFILIFAGYAGTKLGALKLDAKKAFSDLLIYIVTPAMIIDSYMSEFDSKVLSNLLWAFVLGMVLILTGLAITFLTTMKSKGRDTAIMRFACIFSNAAYMGFPLIRALFGEEGLLYASAYVTMFHVIVWTIGYSIVSGEINIKAVMKNILSTPVFISVIIGIIIYIFQIPVPSIIKQPISTLGGMNTALSMIITGMIIAASDMKKMFTNTKLFFAVFMRMLIIPVICVGAFIVASRLGLWTMAGVSPMVLQVVLIQEACPCAAITSVFAVQFNHDEQLAAGAVVISTFLSIITLPVVAYLISSLL